MNLVEVKGIGKPSVFQSDESKFNEWAKHIEDYLIGIEPHFEAMLTWDLETEIRQRMIADKFGENGDPTEQVDGYAQVVVQLKTDLARLTDGEAWLIVQNCGWIGLQEGAGLHKRFDPLSGG